MPSSRNSSYCGRPRRTAPSRRSCARWRTADSVPRTAISRGTSRIWSRGTSIRRRVTWRSSTRTAAQLTPRSAGWRRSTTWSLHAAPDSRGTAGGVFGSYESRSGADHWGDRRHGRLTLVPKSGGWCAGHDHELRRLHIHGAGHDQRHWDVLSGRSSSWSRRVRVETPADRVRFGNGRGVRRAERPGRLDSDSSALRPLAAHRPRWRYARRAGGGDPAGYERDSRENERERAEGHWIARAHADEETAQHTRDAEREDETDRQTGTGEDHSLA